MRILRLFLISILLITFSACDGSPAPTTGVSQPTGSVPSNLTPTPYIPDLPATGAVTQPPQSLQGELINVANAQSLQVNAQVLEGQAQTFSWLPDGDQVALAVEQGIMVYNLAAATVSNHFESARPSNLTNSGQSQWFAWVSDEHTIQILDTQENRQVVEIQSPSGPFTSLSIAPQGEMLAFATFDNHLQLWGPQDGKLSMMKDWQLPYWLSDLTFSPDSTQLAGADLPNFTVHLFDLASGEEVRSLQWTEHASPALYEVEFSPDWRYLAWSARGTVLIMDVDSGEAVATLEHEDFVSAIAWSADSSLLASGAAGTINDQFGPVVYLWEAASGRLVHQLAQQGSVLSMSFSPDGRELAVLTSGGALQVWRVSP